MLDELPLPTATVQASAWRRAVAWLHLARFARRGPLAWAVGAALTSTAAQLAVLAAAVLVGAIEVPGYLLLLLPTVLFFGLLALSAHVGLAVCALYAIAWLTRPLLHLRRGVGATLQVAITAATMVALEATVVQIILRVIDDVPVAAAAYTTAALVGALWGAWLAPAQSPSAFRLTGSVDRRRAARNAGAA